MSKGKNVGASPPSFISIHRFVIHPGEALIVTVPKSEKRLLRRHKRTLLSSLPDVKNILVATDDVQCTIVSQSEAERLRGDGSAR
jgi:hypothetical protein